uniref:Homeobox domain-containing protein n=1 Tax=Periophthalmus magnuspinnatus TaxID=409849 RepID=A0A3B4B904_9GOBI
MHLLTLERMDKLDIKSTVLEFGDRRGEASRLNRDDASPSSLSERCQETTQNGSPKYRKYGSRLGGVKVRHKRQVLQDMARPLKHWLYKHRDNPYPTKTEKVLLALGSHMTLVQVSNWFANARRRLKNTVRQPDLSWALRIKLYNQYIQGNAERLSVCSDDTDTDTAQIRPSEFGRTSSHQSPLQSQSRVLSSGDDGVSGPSKYKSSLLNRGAGRKRRSHSESFSSNDCERDVVSPASSYSTEANYVYHMGERSFNKLTREHKIELQHGGDPGWRELHAAVALTSLAQGQSSGVRIIQKSSHIAEVQTVRVALANCV